MYLNDADSIMELLRRINSNYHHISYMIILINYVITLLVAHIATLELNSEYGIDPLQLLDDQMGFINIGNFNPVLTRDYSRLV